MLVGERCKPLYSEVQVDPMPPPQFVRSFAADFRQHAQLFALFGAVEMQCYGQEQPAQRAGHAAPGRYRAVCGQRKGGREGIRHHSSGNDVLEEFKAQGTGWQTCLNDVLRHVLS